jgi:predicted N-acyltransferase
LSKIRTKIVVDANQLHPEWDILGGHSIFLRKNYLSFLSQNTPQNMECFFIEFYLEEMLSGIAMVQCIQLKQLGFLGNISSGWKQNIQHFFIKYFVDTSLVVGNNMMSGQKAFCCHENISLQEGLLALEQACKQIQKQLHARKINVKLTTFKDFDAHQTQRLKPFFVPRWFCFTTQPNMIFFSRPNWQHFDDYINDLSKKYRDQFKRCRKKAAGIDKRKLSIEDLDLLQKLMHALYLNVVNQSDFNTFFLSENHFLEMKKHLKEDFLVYGYFENGELIGFNTLIKNGSVMETYFLGYDLAIQKEKMLYLNMLYDMVAYSINNGFEQINFGRTALEIKSSIGAEAVPLFGFMQHRSWIFQKSISKLFNFIEPKVAWQKRNPYKEIS